MKKILGILPISIGGRLTTSSILDGFRQNGYSVIVYDELKDDDINNYFNQDYDFIVGYDFSPVKIKIDNNIKFPCITYFSDDINLKTAGVGYLEYKKYLKNEDIFTFYWDRELNKKEKLIYQPHFVNCEIYKDFKEATNDILFMGRFDTDIRLETYLNLNKKLPYSFSWYAIQRHFDDALNRCKNDEEKNILKNTYKGFIDNEEDMALAINKSKIVYNINAQGISSLNYRTIQTLACKRLIISDKRAELDIFENKVPTYDDFEDLANKIDFYLKNKKEYEEITTFCQNIVKEKLNSKVCIKNMLEKIK